MSTHRLRRRTLAITAAVALIRPGVPAAQVTDTGAHVTPGVQVKETVIAEVPKGSEIGATYVNQEHTAWVLNSRGVRTVWLDGKQIGASYEDAKYVRLTPSGSHIAWIAKRDGKWFAVVDGKERTRHYGRMTEEALDGEAKAVLAGACDGKRCHLVSDTAETGAEYEDIAPPGLSPDGEHAMYLGKRQGKWLMVVDGKERGRSYDDVLTYYFCACSPKPLIAVRIKDTYAWVVDTAVGPAYEVISDLALTSDGAHFAYGGVNSEATGFLGRGQHKTHAFIVVDGHAGRQYDGRGFGGGFGEAMGQIQSIAPGVHNLNADFHGVSDPFFTADGKLVYTARLGKGDVALFVDSVAVAHYPDVVSPILTSADGKHTYFVARVGDDYVDVVDQQLATKVPVAERAVVFVSTVTADKDFAHHAYVLVRGGEGFKAGSSRRALRRIVLDGQPGPEFDANGIRDLWFSDDGKHLAYVVVGASGDRDQLVYDRNIGRLYDWIYPASVKVIDDRNVEFTARDGTRWLRVTETVP